MKIAIATGDPAGVGPEVSVRALAALANEWSKDETHFVLFGDGRDLRARLDARGLDGPEVVDVGACDARVVEAHTDDGASGSIALAALDAAIDAVFAERADALVTGPVSKAAIRMAGRSSAVDFVGQTEHLARRVGLPDDQVTMMFLGPRLRVALVTTHLAIRNVPQALTPARVARACVHLAEALERLDSPHGAPIVVTSVNPHAGERGLFGDEDDRAVAPGVRLASTSPPFTEGRFRLLGPVAAESAFRQAAAGEAAGVVAMFHDQATIPSKLLDWEQAVNVTWGLPFVRTSVDHGVAYEAARSGHISASGMLAAIRMARVLRRGMVTR